MNKSKLIIFLIVGSLHWVHAQQIDIQVQESAVSKVYLFELSGEQTVLKDSLVTTENGLFRFSLNERNYHTGFYRLIFGQNKWLDFLNDGKDIFLKTNANNFLDSLQVITSESNQLYYTFHRLNKLYKTKTELLQLILARYPKNDDYYRTTQNKLVSIQKEYVEFVNEISQTDRSSYIARYIRSAQLPVISLNIPQEKQLDYLRGHALDKLTSMIIN